MREWLMNGSRMALLALTLGGLSGVTSRVLAQDLGQTDERAAELADRFANRVAEALRLDDERALRLRAELQRSREMRGEVAARRRSLLRELGELVRRDRADQERVARLLDDVLRLQVREAEINLDEQRRLSDFMVPQERARFLYLRQRLLQRARRRGAEQQRNPLRGDRRPPSAAEQRSVPNTTPGQRQP
jgi:hypothetical protein